MQASLNVCLQAMFQNMWIVILNFRTMKKMIFAFAAVFGFASCSGIIEDQASLKADLVSDLESAIEDEDAEDIVEAYVEYYEEMIELVESNENFLKEAKAVDEKLEDLEDQIRDKELLTKSDRDKIGDAKRRYRKLMNRVTF